MKNTLAIYGCGGTGANIANMQTVTGQSAGFPTTTITIVDTSNSNVIKPTQTAPNIKTKVLPGVSGTGKNRRYSAGIVAPHIDKLLIDHPPGDFNIVVFGASGGSGSVIGPMLLKTLLERGYCAVAFTVISTVSAIETTNAYSCLGDLQRVSKSLNLPVVCGIFDNSHSNRNDVNEKIEARIRALAMLVSGENQELDKTDIINWVNYTRNVKVDPMLVDLCIALYDTDEIPEKAISMITLNSAKPSSVIERCYPLYHAEGTLCPEAITATVHEIMSMDFIITNEQMTARVEALKRVKTDFETLTTTTAGIAATEFDDTDENVM